MGSGWVLNRLGNGRVILLEGWSVPTKPVRFVGSFEIKCDAIGPTEFSSRSSALRATFDQSFGLSQRLLDVFVLLEHLLEGIAHNRCGEIKIL